MKINDYELYDALTRKITAKPTFKDLVESADHNYQPTIDASMGIHYKILKLAYDEAQKGRGSTMRSYPLEA